MCDILALQVLDYALLNAPGAPVKQALLDAGIGVDIDGGFSDGTLQPYFTIIAKYAEAEDADRFREIIRDTLKAQVKEGLNKKSIRAALSTAEFSYREADFGQYPKGLFYCLDIMDTWLYDDDAPFVCLNQLQAFRKLGELAETDYFEKLTEERLLNNTHSSLVILKPKPGLAEEREQAIADGLAAKKAAMSDEEIRQLINETEKLRAWQDQEETEEALATLPSGTGRKPTGSVTCSSSLTKRSWKRRRYRIWASFAPCSHLSAQSPTRIQNSAMRFIRKRAASRAQIQPLTSRARRMLTGHFSRSGRKPLLPNS